MAGDKGIGERVARVEDVRFLRGRSSFTDDLVAEGEVHAVFVRSPHAHARIVAIDADDARAAPGVLLVVTAGDIAEEIPNATPSLSNAPPFDVARGPDGPAAEADQYPLARDVARYLGEPVACVVADSLEAAADAAELVAIDYELLTPVIDMGQALAEGAPKVWDDKPDNLSFFQERGDAAATDAAFAEAAHVARIELVNNRVAIAFMEPRAALAEYDEGGGRWTLRCGCQSAHGMRDGIAGLMGIETHRLRVVVPDMGGGFGARNPVYPEYPVLLVAARRLGRAVKWRAERSESFLTDYQARDHLLRGELALDAEGRFTALRAGIDWRHGAYLGGRNIWVMVAYLAPTLGGPYRIPLGHIAMRGVFSNTAPHAAYRGVGRVESNYLMERLVDAAARASGIDRVELRRRNIVAQAEMPWETPGGAVYEFAINLERAVELADWPGFKARREAAASGGVRKGIGLALYVENDGGVPGEFAEIVANGDGTVTALVGTQDFGMGVCPGSLRPAGHRFRGDKRRLRRYRPGGARRGFARLAFRPDRRRRGRRRSGKDGGAHSNGCHVSEVSVDPATGRVTIDRHSVVADVGRAINPMIVDGQIHGGAAQGLGQALLEEVVYDPETGQMPSGSFMDYPLPRADDLPALAVALNEQPETDNPLGVKGAGESATTGAPGALMNAIRDALGAQAGPLDMPATPERVWRALQGE